VTYHVTIGVVQTNVVILLVEDSIDHHICDLTAFHPRLQIKADLIRGHFYELFQRLINVARAVPVIEERDVAVLLCFRNS